MAAGGIVTSHRDFAALSPGVEDVPLAVDRRRRVAGVNYAGTRVTNSSVLASRAMSRAIATASSASCR